MKNIGKTLFAVYKNDIHIGNIYGYIESDAIISYLKEAKLPNIDENIKKYTLKEAVEGIHFIKSQYIVMPTK